LTVVAAYFKPLSKAGSSTYGNYLSAFCRVRSLASTPALGFPLLTIRPHFVSFRWFWPHREALSVDSCLTGHEFTKPLQNLPHPWILNAATSLIGKLAPGAEIRVSGEHPKMLAPLAGTSQVVRADEPGTEPDIASEDGVEEDCTLLGGKFATGKSVSISARKAHLANPKHASKYTFDTETVYTFDFYQNLLNVNTYSLDLGIANIGMGPILNGQPIQCLGKTTDGRYLWSFQIWNETLLPRDREGETSNKKLQ